MALRPTVSGCRLDTMFQRLGSRDEAILAQLIDSFDEAVNLQAPSARAEAHEILRRAVFEGPRWPDLEVEGELHVMAAIVLAKHDQTHLATDSDFWKMPAVWDFVRDCHPRLSGDARKFVAMFGRGRALFGRKIDTPWSFYGFLTLKQVRTLRAGLLALHQDGQIQGDFCDDLMRWLEAIESQEMDLWFYCS